MIDILSDTSGEFIFLDINYNKVIFTDYREIPDNFVFRHVIKFLPNIPPAPHSVKQHEIIGRWKEILKHFMEIEKCQQQRA